MAIRLCSILVTSLLILSADPVAAAGKKKKGKRADTEQSEDKADKKSDAEGDEKSEDAEEEFVEPDSWERPPEEEEKPPPEAPKPVEKEVVGDGLPISAGLLLGWGLKTDRRTADYGADPYGLSAGLRGGYSLDMGVYVGAYYIWYLGSSSEGQGSARTGGAFAESSASYMHFGAEVGYDAWIGPVIIRPSLMLGMALALLSRDGVHDTVGDLVLGPGITMVHPFDEFFIGGDLRGSIVTGDGVSAVSLFATGGMRFQ